MANRYATGTWHNGGALTTAFVPSPSCRSSNFLCLDQGGVDANCATETWVRPNFSALGCWPDITGTPGVHPNYFSPAVCPSGWTSASDVSSWYATEPVATFVPPLAPGESIAACCPRGYVASFVPYTQGYIGPGFPDNGNCISVLRDSITVSVSGRASSVTLGPTNVIGAPYTALEQFVFVRWQSSDLSAFPADIVSSLTTTSRPSPAPTTPGGESTNSSEPGLSQNAKIAIGVSVGVVMPLLLVLLSWLFLRLRRRRLPPPRAGAEELSAQGVTKMELATEEREVELPAGTGNDAGRQVQGGIPAPESEEREPVELDGMPRTRTRASAEALAEAEPVETEAGEESAEVVGGSSSRAVANETAGASSRSARGGDEESQLLAEEKRLEDRRTTLQETLRLLEEDERLRKEQEAVRQRLSELRKESQSDS